jgi:transcriptional regulator with XRE-family HTH domain
MLDRVDSFVNPVAMHKKNNFGRLLRNLRRESGVSIKRLAPELGVTYSYVSKLENGATLPSQEVVHKAAKYFSFDVDSLLLAAGKVPQDVLKILQENPEDAVVLLRQNFGAKDDHRR